MAAHIHAELMAQYTQDAMESETPWEKWEYAEKGWKQWFPCADHPHWSIYNKYRRKPETIMVNGIEVPEPMVYPPKYGITYYLANPLSEFMYSQWQWTDSSSSDHMWLNRGLLHTTKEAAIKHGKAMLGIKD